MKRADLLDAAKQIVCRDRQETHGDLKDNFATIAELWSIYLGRKVEMHDVAAMMALLKIARIRANPLHHDSWTDLAGYAACGAEVSA